VLTRRHFIERAALAGGASLAYEAMTGLGLLAAPQTAAPFDLQGSGNGARVVVIGAGLAGLTVAYELGKLGYAVQVLEARERPGGRAHTICRGTVSEEDGSSQACAFDEGQYFNCGAMRIPYHHTTTLGYCRELQVPVETFALVSEAAYLYQTKTPALKDRRVRLREVRTDMDGYVAELLSKAVSDHALDEALTPDDRERLLEYLRSKGALDASGRYHGGPLRGADVPASPDATARYTPLPLDDLLGSRTGYYLDLGFQYQQTMVQVVGGTDQLPRALAARVGKKVTYRAAVQSMRQHERGVTIVYKDAQGAPHEVHGDYCVCALPLPLLADIDTDFSADFKSTIAKVPYAAAGKMGLQFRRRFWEEDDHIFGARRSRHGDRPDRYPRPVTREEGRSSAITCGRVGPSATRRRPSGWRWRPSRAAASTRSMDGVRDLSVAWHRVTWNRGPGRTRIRRRGDCLPSRRAACLAGDHLNMNAWMQGAFESARQCHCSTPEPRRNAPRQGSDDVRAGLRLTRRGVVRIVFAKTSSRRRHARRAAPGRGTLRPTALSRPGAPRVRRASVRGRRSCPAVPSPRSPVRSSGDRTSPLPPCPRR
jgi:monoamine oxidase